MTNGIDTNSNGENSGKEKKLHFFEKYLTLWVLLCIAGGMVLGKAAPQFAGWLDGLAIYVNQAPVISIPIAICLFFMMYPIMVKIDFAEVLKAGKRTSLFLDFLSRGYAYEKNTDSRHGMSQV